MAKLLFDESPLVVQPTLAKAIGLNEAIILQQINYWMNQRGGKVINGAKWIYNTVAEWQKQFPFWSEDTIARTLKNLEDARLVKTGVFNKSAMDRTKWYSIDFAAVELLDALITQEQELEAEALRNAIPQNAEMEDRNLPESNQAECGNIPESTSEISTEIAHFAPMAFGLNPSELPTEAEILAQEVLEDVAVFEAMPSASAQVANPTLIQKAVSLIQETFPLFNLPKKERPAFGQCVAFDNDLTGLTIALGELKRGNKTFVSPQMILGYWRGTLNATLAQRETEMPLQGKILKNTFVPAPSTEF